MTLCNLPKTFTTAKTQPMHTDWQILTTSNMSIHLSKRGKKSINFLLLKDAQLDGRWAASAKLEVHRWPLHSPQPKKPLKYPPLHQLLQK